MSKSIKLCLVYRDMWQASGKYMPRVDQLVKVAPAIIDMGCFSRVETNGGGFEQINLLYGENPNISVRKWTQAFNDVGIQTQMLERGLNGIRMSPVPLDVRQLMFKVKKKQGTDISRSFDGLNNPQNLKYSFQYAKEGGMIAQGALSLTHSPIHTVDYYVDLADKFVDLGAEEICIKDMAGIGRPTSVGKIVKGIRKRHGDIIIQYHGHSTTGFSIASSLEAARHGADIIDVGMEPLSWGTGHADLLSIHAMLKDADFVLPDINVDAYMEARRLTQEFIDDFLGYYINPKNRFMNSLVIGPGLPGGMMGSLMADLERNLISLNRWMDKNGKPHVTQDELLIKLFKEVEFIWPMMGYPPLVTPFSQYVKNTALMNVMQMEKGKARWSMIDENTWNMLLGKSGQLPGPVHQDLIDLAKEQSKEFYNDNPQDLYPNDLDKYIKEMKDSSWDRGEDDEELMELAMHPEQYRDFRSGAAKSKFLEDLAKRKAPKPKALDSSEAVSMNKSPESMLVDVNGVSYKVTLRYDEGDSKPEASVDRPEKTSKNLREITSPLEGKFLLSNGSTAAKKVGDKIAKGDVIGYVESMKVLNAIVADKSGEIAEIVAVNGEDIFEDDVILRIS